MSFGLEMCANICFSFTASSMNEIKQKNNIFLIKNTLSSFTKWDIVFILTEIKKQQTFSQFLDKRKKFYSP